MSRWTHSICVECWNKQNPARSASRAGGGEPDVCCWCGKQHDSGIYVRSDPEELRCKGNHDGA